MLIETCIVGQYFLDHKFYAALLVTYSLPSRLDITNDVGTNKSKKFRPISRRLFAWPLTYQCFNTCNVDVSAGTISCVNVSISTRVSNISKLWQILYNVLLELQWFACMLIWTTEHMLDIIFKPYQLEWHPHPTLFYHFCLVHRYTVYPKKYAHGFIVLCFVVVMQSFIMNSHEVFIHIHQGCFAGTGTIVRLPQCQWSKPDGYGKSSQCITTTKHSKAKTASIFLGIYCTGQFIISLLFQHVCFTLKYQYSMPFVYHTSRIKRGHIITSIHLYTITVLSVHDFLSFVYYSKCYICLATFYVVPHMSNHIRSINWIWVLWWEIEINLFPFYHCGRAIKFRPILSWFNWKKCTNKCLRTLFHRTGDELNCRWH